MPWNGSGVFARVYSWVADANAGLDILADRMDTDSDDIAQGLMHCLTVNGETVPTANLPMANYRHTGAAAGVADTDYATLGQIKNGGGGLGAGFLPLSGGTINGNLTVNGSLAAGTAALGNVTASGTLGVAGAATLAGVTASNLTVNGSLAAGTTSLGNVTASGTLHVTGATTLGSTTTGGLTVNGSLAAGTASLGNVTSSGTLTVGNTATFNGALNANGTTNCGGQVVCAQNIYPATDNSKECGIAGSAWFGVESYAFVNHSDARSKTGLAPLDADCLALVRAIAPQRFRWAARPDDAAEHWGFTAQDVGAAMAAAGHQFGGHLVDPETGRERLAYSELVALLWRAVQQLSERLEALGAPAREA